MRLSKYKSFPAALHKILGREEEEEERGKVWSKRRKKAHSASMGLRIRRRQEEERGPGWRGCGTISHPFH